jgi:hypothetical protein
MSTSLTPAAAWSSPVSGDSVASSTVSGPSTSDIGGDHADAGGGVSDAVCRIIPAAIGAALGGGIYAGIMRGAPGAPDYHLVLLPGDIEGDYAKAQEFAASAGGELPSRREQRVLFANLKDQFEADWYWSGEQHASDPSGAWSQLFDAGFQYYTRKGLQGRVRVVRRLPI